MRAAVVGGSVAGFLEARADRRAALGLLSNVQLSILERFNERVQASLNRVSDKRTIWIVCSIVLYVQRNSTPTRRKGGRVARRARVQGRDPAKISKKKEKNEKKMRKKHS